MSPQQLDDVMQSLAPARALNKGRAVICVAALVSSALFAGAVRSKDDVRARADRAVLEAQTSVRQKQDDLYVPQTEADTGHSQPLYSDPCLPSGDSPVTKFPSLIQLAAGYQSEGVPYGGVLFSDRGQYGELHHGTYDLQEMRDNVVQKYDQLLAYCLESTDASADDVCKHSYATQCSLDQSDDSKRGQVSCVEDCVNSRFSQFVESEGIVEDASTCAYPVLSGFLLAPNVIKSCIDPSYDATEGGKHTSAITGCYDCVTTCLDGERFAFTCSDGAAEHSTIRKQPVVLDDGSVVGGDLMRRSK
jgi:hypothetical protein